VQELEQELVLELVLVLELELVLVLEPVLEPEQEPEPELVLLLLAVLEDWPLELVVLVATWLEAPVVPT